MAHVAVIVQARTGSTRLPRKVLRPYKGHTLLGHILTRLHGLDVWVATPDGAVALEAKGYGARAFVGPEDDVMARFVGCVDAMPVEPDAVMRICADRPFVSRELVDAMIGYWQTVNLDYLAPTPGGWPFSGEIVSVEALRRMDRETPKWSPGREHVTPFFDSDRYRCEVFPVAIDTDEDYQKLRAA